MVLEGRILEADLVFSKRRKVPRERPQGAGDPFAFTKGQVSSRMRPSRAEYSSNQLDWSYTVAVILGIDYGYTKMTQCISELLKISLEYNSFWD